MFSNFAVHESISRRSAKEKCHWLWVKEACVNMILMHCRGGEKKNFFQVMLKEINLHPNCQTRFWKEMECQSQHDFLSYIKAPWVQWPLMHSKHQDSFWETSCPWLQPYRQSSRRDRFIPKLSPRQSWSRVQTKENPYGRGERWREGEKKK